MAIVYGEKVLGRNSKRLLWLGMQLAQVQQQTSERGKKIDKIGLRFGH